MDFKETPFWIFWMQYGKHIEAVAIIVLLILVWFTYHKNNELQETIKENCGWGDEKYYCICEKESVEFLKSKLNNIENPLMGGDLINVSLVK